MANYREGILRVTDMDQTWAAHSPAATYESDSRVANRENRRANGVAYTPPVLARYVARKVMGFFLEERRRSGLADSQSVADLRVLDPACGNGELLAAAWEEMEKQFSEKPPPQLLSSLCGVDIDDVAASSATDRLRNMTNSKLSAKAPRIFAANALSPIQDLSLKGAWAKLLNRFDAPNGFDIIIANPPWGADISHYRDRLDREELTLLRGQFDSSDLFIELALSIVKPRGFLAFIVPDSLFSLERKALRELFIKQTQLHLIARLGEKFFDKINRACAVVICQKVEPDANAMVECLRLTPAIRKAILKEDFSFNDAELELMHSVPQRRFAENTECTFDIDLAEHEDQTVKRIKLLPKTFGDYLWNGRGIELSKSGEVTQCSHCKVWSPTPSRQNSACSTCGRKLNLLAARKQVIISANRLPGYSPIFVGENIQRYFMSAHRWIKPGFDGINYKDRALYKGPKLLVRKTGVGVSANIDYSDAYTTQVVYIFGLKNPRQHPNLSLEAVLAILNSRAMYYFLAKTHGETEWRSHPYLTQAQILGLPCFNLTDLTPKQTEALKDITRLLRPVLAKGKPVSTHVDARIESLVATLLGLVRSDYEVIYRTLESVEGLLPVRNLRQVSLHQIFPH